MSGLEIHDTEYLKSIFVAVGKGQVEQFEREIYGLGSELVRYGGVRRCVLVVWGLICTNQSSNKVDSLVVIVHQFAFIINRAGLEQRSQWPWTELQLWIEG